MKKLLSILLILSFSFAAHAWDYRDSIKAVIAAKNSGGFGYCNDITDSDIMCEDFLGSTTCVSGESSTCRTSWSSITETGGTVAFDNVPSVGIGCTDLLTHTLKISKTVNTDTTCNAIYSTSAKTSVHGVIYFKINSTNIPSGNELRILWIGQDTTTNFCLVFTLQNISGNFYIKTSHYNGSGYDNNTSVASVSIDQWYPINFTWDSGILASANIDLNNDGDFNDTNEGLLNDNTDIGSRGAQYYGFGQEYTSTLLFSLEFANIKFDSNTVPSFCSR